MRSWCVSLTAIALSACNVEVSEVVLEVDHYRVPCLSEELQLCMLAREDEKGEWERFFDDIVGWEHTWGRTTQLNLEKQIPFSATTVAAVYELQSVAVETEVAPGTRFTYPFRPSESFGSVPAASLIDEGPTGTLMDGAMFTCPDQAVCDTLAASSGSRGSVIPTLEYADPIDDPFVLTAVDNAD